MAHWFGSFTPSSAESLRKKRAAVAWLACLAMLLSVFTIIKPLPARAEAAAQLAVTRIDPSPQPTGTQMIFRVQAQCSALDEGVCRNAEIRWPDQAPSTFSLSIPHPAIESFYLDVVTGEWVVDIQDLWYAGTSIEFDVVATVPNHTTPDGTTVEVDATLTAENVDSVSDGDMGAWSASANLSVEKYLQYGPDTDAVLDQPVRYYIYPCDPTWLDGTTPGHLYVTDVTIVDRLPAGVQFNSASPGGSYDAAANEVTWAVAGTLSNESCAFKGPSDYWIDVTFPSTVFGPDSIPLRLEAINNVTVEGWPIGETQTSGNLLTDSRDLLHGFGMAGVGAGNISKSASTPYYNDGDMTWAGDLASFSVSLIADPTSSTPYYFRLTDPVPCLDYTPNASTQYESRDPGDYCTVPAWQPNDRMALLVSLARFGYADKTTFVAAHPELTLQYVDTTGAVNSLVLPYDPTFTLTGYVLYELEGDALRTALGLAPGIGVAEVIWDSEADGLLVLADGSSGLVAQMGLRGDVADDTPAYPVLDQYRVRNWAHLDLIYGGTEMSAGMAQDDVVIVDEIPAFRATKEKDTNTGRFWLTNYFTGAPLRAGEDFVLTDLLPAGYEFDVLDSLQYNLFDADDPTDTSAGLWRARRTGSTYEVVNATGNEELDGLDPRSYVDIEVIDDYNGSGRQLVRFTFSEPPIPGGWQKPNASGWSWVRVGFYVTPFPFSLSGTNEVRAFSTDPVTSANLQCSRNLGDPTAALSNDTDDQDGDGITSGDAYCHASISVTPSGSLVAVDAHKAVKGDADPEFRPFPAIGAIGSSGGTADFQINLTNLGTALDNLVIYDVLPHLGDTGLTESLVGTPRGSAWDATFVGIDPATLPGGARVEYSASTNPCRDELTTGSTPFPIGCVNDWSTALPPGGASDVEAFRITFPSGDIQQLDPLETLSIEYQVGYPAGVQPGEVAWNTFAYTADRVDDGSSILPAEPPKVGLAIPQVDIEVTKSVDPATVFVGTPVTYTVVVDHAGAVSPDGSYTPPGGTAYDVILEDDVLAQGLTIVPGSSSVVNDRTGLDDGADFDESTGELTIPVLGVEDHYVLTYRAYSSVPLTATNTAEITAHPNVDDIDSTPNNHDPTEDDQDEATAAWVEASIDLQKQVEDFQSSGNFIEADATDGLVGQYGPNQPVPYRFVVTNTGGIGLSNISLTDDLAGYTCDQTVAPLLPGESTTIDCTWPYGYSPGSHVNTATITADATAGGDTRRVTDTDPAEVVVQDADLSVVKTISDGPTTTGTPNQYTVEYTLTVTNTGPGATSYSLSDDLRFGSGVIIDDIGSVNPSANVTTAIGTVEGAVVIGEPIASGAVETFTYTVTYTVTTSVTAISGDCTLDAAETGTGTLNTTTMTRVDGTTDTSDVCEPVTLLTISKSALSASDSNGDGVWSVQYEVTVSNVGAATTTYDLTDSPNLDSDVVIAAPNPAATAVTDGFSDPAVGLINSWTAGPTSNTGALDLVSGQTIGVGETHTYTVALSADISALVADPALLDACDPADPAPGEAFYNRADLSYEGGQISGEDCVDPTLPELTLDKAVTSSTVSPDGSYTIAYDITITNTTNVPSSYELTDMLGFPGSNPGDGDDVTIDTVAVVSLDGNPVNAAFNGGVLGTSAPGDPADSAITSGSVTISGTGDPASPEVDTYRVTVTGVVEPGVPLDRRLCDAVSGPEGYGFFNTAIMDWPGGIESASDCEPISDPAFTIEKTPDTAIASFDTGSGEYVTVYTVTVTNVGEAPGVYDIFDDVSGFSAGVDVVSAEITSAPAGATLNSGWTGFAPDTLVASGVPLAGDPDPADPANESTHVYELTVRSTIDPAASPEELICDGLRGNGFFNVASLESGQSDAGCYEVSPELSIDKVVTSGPTLEDATTGRYQVVYTITVENIGVGPTTYDLTDELRFGAGIFVPPADGDPSPNPSIEQTSTTTPYGLPKGTPVAGWDGGQTRATAWKDVPLEAGGIDTYTVTVDVLVPPSVTTDARTCDVAGGETIDGLTNFASAEDAVSTVDATDCVDAPDVDLGIAKTHSTPSYDPATGLYTVSYDITVTNDGGAPGEYTLTDDFGFAAGLIDPTVTAIVGPAGVTLNHPGFDGETDQIIAADVVIPANGTHRYTVTVTTGVEVQTLSARECVIETAGEGMFNEASLDNGLSDDTCPEVFQPEIVMTKVFVDDDDDPANGLSGFDLDPITGDFAMSYEVNVTNAGRGPGWFTLTDDVRFGSGIVIDSVSVTSITGLATNPGFNGGVSPLPFVAGVDSTDADADHDVTTRQERIEPGATHTFVVTVTGNSTNVVVNATPPPDASDCVLDTGETGTGFLNVAGVTWEGGFLTDDACDSTPLPALDLLKTPNGGIIASPNPDGTYTVEYAIAVSNKGEGAGTYELSDDLRFGDGISPIVDPPNTPRVTVDSTGAAAGAVINPAWDGIGDDLITMAPVTIGAGDTHIYTVTVDATLDGSTTLVERDCVLEITTDGEGLLNNAAIDDSSTVIDAAGCIDAPEPDYRVTKSITSGPTELPDGTYEIVYDIVVTNTGQGHGAYELDDEISFGDGVGVFSATVANTSAGSQQTTPIATNPLWNGGVAGLPASGDPGDVDVTTRAEEIYAGDSHTYQVRVIADASHMTPVDIDQDPADCTLQGSEAATGFLNSATIEFENGALGAEDCAEVPDASIDHTKVLTGGPTLVDPDANVYEVSYTITVLNSGAGSGLYTLDDQLLYGEGVDVVGASITNTTGGVSDTWTGSWDGGVDWDSSGASNTRVVTDELLLSGETHTYEVTVTARLDVSSSPTGRDCFLETGESGTGALNQSTLSTSSMTETKGDCGELPPADVHIAKSVVGTPRPLGGGRFEIVYDLTVTNMGSGAGAYDLADALSFGDGLTVLTSLIENTRGGVAPNYDYATANGFNPDWNGLDTTAVAVAEPIPPAGVHVYRVTVGAQVATGMTSEQRNCTLLETESGTGFLNTAVMNFDDVDTRVTDCAPVPDPILVMTKTVAGQPVAEDDGTWTVEYDLLVSSQSPTPTRYTLTDQLRFADSITVEGATVGNVIPGGITTSSTWDGVDDTTIVANEPIDGANVDGSGNLEFTQHLYRVSANVSLDTAMSVAEGDCQLLVSESGTGFLNTSKLEYESQSVEAEACAEAPGPALEVAKTLVSGPTLNDDGTYTVTYQIEVTALTEDADGNTTGPGTYTLTDALLYGGDIEVVAATVSSSDAEVSETWDGIVDIVIVSGVQIDPGDAHIYTVETISDIDPTVAMTAGDCQLTTTESGTGFLNHASVYYETGTMSDQDCAPTPGAHIELEKQVEAITELNPGSYRLEYRLLVSNTGDRPDTYDLDDAIGFADGVEVVKISMKGPDNVVLNSGFDGETDTRIATDVPIGVADVHEFSVEIEITLDLPSGSPESALDCERDPGEDGTGFFNGATVTVDDEQISDDACGPIPSDPDVELTKVVSETSVVVGSEVEWTIEVFNKGPVTARGLVVEDVLPDGVDYVSHHGGDYDPDSGRWTIGDLAAGGRVVLRITTKMTRQGWFENVAEVSRMSQRDIDSTPGNHRSGEDDQDEAVVTVTFRTVPFTGFAADRLLLLSLVLLAAGAIVLGFSRRFRGNDGMQ